MKTALITRITRQDGAYLAEHLLRLGWTPKTSVEELARMMVEVDLRRRKQDASQGAAR